MGFLEIIGAWLQNLLGFDLLGVLGALTASVSALIALFLLIPGEQPEKFLQKILDFLAKLSLK